MGKETEEIVNKFIEVCKVGTFEDRFECIQEAKRYGISYEKLLAYQQIRQEDERKTFVKSQIKKGCDKCSQWDDYWGCNKCESI